MRFKMVCNEVSHSTKSGFLGLFNKTDTYHEFKILAVDKVDDYLNFTNTAYTAAFGSFDLFRVAKGFAVNEDSRFSVVGFFLNKSGENFDKAIFVKVESLSEIYALWEELSSKEMTPNYRMMRSVVLKDKVSGERIVLEAFFDLNIDFKDSAKNSMIECFNNEFVEIMKITTENDDFGKELDRLFVKSLEKFRADKN